MITNKLEIGNNLTWEKMTLEATVIWKHYLYIESLMNSTDKC